MKRDENKGGLLDPFIRMIHQRKAWLYFAPIWFFPESHDIRGRGFLGEPLLSLALFWYRIDSFFYYLFKGKDKDFPIRIKKR